MLSPATERADSLRQPPAGVPAAHPDEKGLRTELDALNLELRELKSTDHAVRTYVETWLGFVTGSVGVKLLFDWQKTQGKLPYVAFPLILAGLALLVDAMLHRLEKSRLAVGEERQMLRQRELRGLLGLDDAPVPFGDDAVADLAPAVAPAPGLAA